MVTLRAIVRVTPSRRSIMSYISHVAILLLYVSAVVAIAPCPVTLPGNQVSYKVFVIFKLQRLEAYVTLIVPVDRFALKLISLSWDLT